MEKLLIYIDGDGGIVVLTWGKKEENKVFVVSDSALLVIAGYGTYVCPPGGSTR